MDGDDDDGIDDIDEVNDDSDDLYSRTCMSVCSLPISSSLGARTASEIFCQITQFKEQPSSSPSPSSTPSSSSSSSSSSMIWVHVEPQAHCNVFYHLCHFSVKNFHNIGKLLYLNEKAFRCLTEQRRT